ncbi:MAG: glycosyltransferase family A protein [Crocinitomicaceae bacterium]|nr:glycosyltransferase family A protein [Crocinitomicaceae bacterium]
MPKFSIILPTYNRADFLGETIDSVINQQFIDWELLIIDDGSTDNSKEFCQDYVNKDPRIKYHYQENQERSAARNNGIGLATGEYICFLDSDDLMLSNHLEVLNRFIEKCESKEALFFTNCTISNQSVEENSKTPQLGSNPFDYFISNPVIPTRVCLSSIIARKYQFREDSIISEDMMYWMEVSYEHPVFQINEFTVFYRVHEGNSVSLKNNHYPKMLRALTRFKNEKPHILNKLSPKVRKQAFSQIQYGISRYNICTGNRGRAIIHLIAAIIKKPIHFQNRHRVLLMFTLLFRSMTKVQSIVNCK